MFDASMLNPVSTFENAETKNRQRKIFFTGCIAATIEVKSPRRTWLRCGRTWNE
jgi:hypothetical protein